MFIILIFYDSIDAKVVNQAYKVTAAQLEKKLSVIATRWLARG